MQPVPASASGSAAPRGCLLFLVQTAASMARPIAALGGSSGIAAACRTIEETLARLIVLASQGELGRGSWDVAVVGHGGSADQPLRSLLPGGMDDQPFVPLESLTTAMLIPPSISGPGGAAGLARASLLLQSWLLGRDHVLRPLIVFCGDESGLDSGLTFPGLLLRVHCTARGPVLLAICGFSAERSRPVSLPSPARAAATPPWEKAWAFSSQLPTTSGVEKHALSINDSSPAGLVRLVRFVGRQGRSPVSPWKLNDGLPAACECKVLWAPKDGSSREEYEDSFSVDAGNGRAVIADGASQGIFARLWANLLTSRFLGGDFDLADPGSTDAWLAGCRREWRAAIHYDTLHGLQQDKVDEVGAAATLLALSIHRVGELYRWRAAALGDSCLFWARGESLVAVFPLCRSSDFGIAPDLVPTVKRFAPRVRFITAEGFGKPGDLFGLATDAVAQYLLQSVENDQSIDLSRYLPMEETQWHEELRQARRTRRIVNDDSTLVLLRLKEPSER
jgi:hypothetical protein